jgi:POT family proton-dependent oligopeptide transporter
VRASKAARKPESDGKTMVVKVEAISHVRFRMVFNRSGSTLTFWADDNTDWSVSGTVSNAINSFWIISLTFPLIWFWNRLARRGKESSTPAKMAVGMLLTSLSFFVLY